MKRSLLLTLLVTASACACLPAQIVPTFETAWGLGPAKYTRLVAVDVDNEGSQYFAGTITHHVDLDPSPAQHSFSVNGDADIVVYKLDSSHNWVWGRQMGSSGAERVSHLELDYHRRCAVAGAVTTTYDIDPGAGQFTLSTGQGHKAYVLRLDANGDFLWAAPLRCTSSLAIKDIAFDKHDNLYVMGDFRGKADLDPGPDTLYFTAGDQYGDMFVMKLDVQGHLEWARQLAGTGADEAVSIDIDERSDLFLSGNFKDHIDLDPGAGQAVFQSNGGTDIFLCKLNEDGDFQWGRAIGNPNNDESLGLQTNQADELFLFGTCLDVLDGDPGAGVHNIGGAGVQGMYLLKLDAQTAVMHSKFWIINTIVLQPNTWEVFDDGSLQFTGRFTQTTDFNPNPGNYPLTPQGAEDAFLFVLTPSAQLLWAGRVGGADGFVHPSGTTMDRFGNIYAVGQFRALTDFDPGTPNFPIDGGQQYMGFVLKLHRDYQQAVAVDAPAAMLQLWPNPGQGAFRVSLPDGAALRSVAMYDVRGQQVGCRVAAEGGEVVVEGEWSPGIYVVQVATDTGIATLRWVQR